MRLTWRSERNSWSSCDGVIPTGDKGESAQTGEGADVNLQEMKGFTEVEDTVQPVAETALTLFQREDDAVAEHQLRVVRIRAVRQPEHEQFQTGRLEEQFLKKNDRIAKLLLRECTAR